MQAPQRLCFKCNETRSDTHYKSPSVTGVLKLYPVSESPGGPLNTLIAGAIPRILEPIGLGAGSENLHF